MKNKICGKEGCKEETLHWHRYDTDDDIKKLARLRNISEEEARITINRIDRDRCSIGSDYIFDFIDKLRFEYREKYENN